MIFNRPLMVERKALLRRAKTLRQSEGGYSLKLDSGSEREMLTRGVDVPAGGPYPAGELIDDFEAHLPSRPGNDTEGGFVTARVQILGFRLHDIHDLFTRDLANFRLVRLFRAGRNVRRFL